MSPLVRLWLTQHSPRIDWVDVCDHAYACWRGLLHGLGGREYDPLELDREYITLLQSIGDKHAALMEVIRAAKLPVPVSASTVAAGTPGTAVGVPAPPSPAFSTLLPCPVCKVSVGKDCITRFGNVTGPHRARREAAAAQTAETS